jgi:hypothetical protein
MRRLVCVLVMLLAASPAGAWYPSTPQVEFATATW